LWSSDAQYPFLGYLSGSMTASDTNFWRTPARTRHLLVTAPIVVFYFLEHKHFISWTICLSEVPVFVSEEGPAHYFECFR